jgi:hypothetical protein
MNERDGMSEKGDTIVQRHSIPESWKKVGKGRGMKSLCGGHLL